MDRPVTSVTNHESLATAGGHHLSPEWFPGSIKPLKVFERSDVMDLDFVP